MIRRTPGALALCSLIAASGCGGELLSDYTLNLVPHTLTGQDPFQNGREVELVIVAEDGTTEVFYAGSIAGGQVQANEVPPVADGSSVGILVEEAGGTAGSIDLDRAVAWGSAVVDGGLAADGKTVTLDVLVAEIATLGDMGTLGANKRSVGAGVAMVPGGDVYIFGGAADSEGSPPTDRIQWMGATDSGTWSFEKIDATLPEREGIPGALFGVAATTVEVDGEPMIFVSGGRDTATGLGGGVLQSPYGFLFDPATQEIVWGDKPAHEDMTAGRSEHGHLLMDNGKVLIYGGWENSVSAASLVVFTPNSKRFDYIGSVTHGAAVPAAASLGPDGALVCGGGDVDAGADLTTPTDACDLVTLGGVVTSTNSMPDPVLGHAMARLADGRVLATGGILTAVGDLASAQATNEAWIYDGGSWSIAPAQMKTPRAHHEIIPMPDGDAIILGGVTDGGAVFPGPSGAVICAEIFDAKANTFTELAPCSGAGSGAFPRFSAIPTEGAFILAGEDTSADTPSGDDFGFIAFTPPL